MAYLALSEGTAGAVLPAPFFAPASVAKAQPAAEAANDAAEPARLSALEWSVVAIARKDSLGSLNEAGPLTIAFNRLFGVGGTKRLSDDRLEALRRIAVLAWHYGYVIPTTELKAFLKAGFSTDQYELLQASISKAHESRNVARNGGN